MNQDTTLLISPLNNQHNRSVFCCGVGMLDTYIQKQASQDNKRNVSRIFVATTQDQPEAILGYYTLSTLSLAVNDMPEAYMRKLPKHPIPTALIGRLAVGQQAQGNGIGKMLVIDAINRIVSISQDIAVYAIVVDAIDHAATKFYTQFGFMPLNMKTRRLFVPLRTVMML